MPNAEYVQPKAETASELKSPGISEDGRPATETGVAPRRESMRGARPSEGINAEELWKPDGSAKARLPSFAISGAFSMAKTSEEHGKNFLMQLAGFSSNGRGQKA